MSGAKHGGGSRRSRAHPALQGALRSGEREVRNKGGVGQHRRPALHDSHTIASFMRAVRDILSFLSLAGLLAACGVRGAPQPPPGSDPNKNKNRPIVLDKLI